MSNYATVDTPGGSILVELENTDNVDGIELASSRGSLPSFEEAGNSLKENAKYLLEIMKDLSPNEVEVSCGIKVGAEGGNILWGLAKTSGEASFTITLKWNDKKDGPQKKPDENETVNGA